MDKLRTEYEKLQRENRLLWDQLSPNGRLPACLGLGRREGRLLASLLANGELRKEALLLAMFSDVPEASLPEIKSVDVAVFHLRKRLRPHDINVATPRTGNGYFIPLRDRARVAHLIRSEVISKNVSQAEYVQIDLVRSWRCPKMPLAQSHGRRTLPRIRSNE